MNSPIASVSIVTASIISMLTTPSGAIHISHMTSARHMVIAQRNTARPLPLTKSAKLEAAEDDSHYCTQEEVELERYRLKGRSIGDNWAKKTVTA